MDRKTARFGDITVTRGQNGSVTMDQDHIPGGRRARQARFWEVEQAQAALASAMMRGGGQTDLAAALKWVVRALREG